MKILCQERYDKAIAYAKEIKNDTLQKCIDRLKQWEENPNCPCEIELYYDSAPHSFGFRQVYPDGRTGIVGGLHVPTKGCRARRHPSSTVSRSAWH